MTTVKLKLAPKFKQQVQRSQSHTGDKAMLTFYADPEFAVKVNQLAKLTQRSLSSVLAEMLTFALDQLEDGDAKLEDTGIQRNIQDVTFADIAEESLKRIVPELSYGEHRPGAPRIYRTQEEKWVEERKAQRGK